MSVRRESSETPHVDPAGWLQEHGDAIYAFAMMRVKNSDLAEDLVQDTLLAAWKNQDGFRGQSSERTWLIGILKHKLVDHHRRVGRTEVADAELREEALARWTENQYTSRLGKWKTMPRNWAVDSSTIERAEFLAVLDECMEKLPPRAGEALLLAERDGLSTRIVSNVLGLTATNVGVILHRARAAMRHCLDTNWFHRKDATP